MPKKFKTLVQNKAFGCLAYRKEKQMKIKLLEIMIKIADWCRTLAFKLQLDKEYAEMIKLQARLRIKLQEEKLHSN